MPWIIEQDVEISWDLLQGLMGQTVAEARRRICARPKRVLLLPPDITRSAPFARGEPADVRLDPE
jgi:hypothetical protein